MDLDIQNIIGFCSLIAAFFWNMKNMFGLIKAEMDKLIQIVGEFSKLLGIGGGAKLP